MYAIEVQNIRAAIVYNEKFCVKLAKYPDVLPVLRQLASYLPPYDPVLGAAASYLPSCDPVLGAAASFSYPPPRLCSDRSTCPQERLHACWVLPR